MKEVKSKVNTPPQCGQLMKRTVLASSLFGRSSILHPFPFEFVISCHRLWAFRFHKFLYL